MTHPVFICLWFYGKAKEVATHYCLIFTNSKIAAENPLVVVFEWNEAKSLALNVRPNYTFSATNSYFVTRHTKEKIDHYWKK